MKTKTAQNYGGRLKNDKQQYLLNIILKQAADYLAKEN
jgi:hypothetical protein